MFEGRDECWTQGGIASNTGQDDRNQRLLVVSDKEQGRRVESAASVQIVDIPQAVRKPSNTDEGEDELDQSIEYTRT